jgi:N-acetylneuraminic acid mutarotase
MKPFPNMAVYILLTGIVFYISCKKEYSCEGCATNPTGTTNKPPIAVAGPDQVITLPADSVSLDGSNSSDPDGTISGWLWTKISGPASFNIINSSATGTVVKNLTAGVYKFELKVKDNGGLSAKDTVQIIVDDPAVNQPPVANAGSDQTITLPVNAVNLDGSASTDPDNNIISYAWTKITGPSSFNIINANAVQTQVNNLVQGIYQFELKVADVGALFSRDTIQVTVNAAQPDSCAASRPIVPAQLTPFGTLSEGRYGIAVASAGNKIVFAGGNDGGGNPLGGEATSRVDIYDIVTHNWSTAELSVARMDMAVAVSGNKIFFAAGWDTDETTFSIYYTNVDIYDASTDSWAVDSLSVLRGHVVAGAVGTKVFFAGGWDNITATALNIVDIYDLSTNSWSVATLSEARMKLSAVTIDNKIYFAGGSTYYNSPSNRIDIYNNTTGSWSSSTLIEPKALMASIAFAGKIYWAGGQTSGNTISSQVEIKDVNTQTSSVACLFQPNVDFDAVEKNNKIVFFTGREGVRNKFDIYDVTTNSWSIGVLNQNFTFPAAIISVNNTIYVAGGYVNGVFFNQVWKLEF